MIANTKLQFLFEKAEIKEKLLQIEQFHEAIVKQKNAKGSDAFISVDGYFQLAFRVGKTWDLVEEIFIMWENIRIKNKKVKKVKLFHGPVVSQVLTLRTFQKT